MLCLIMEISNLAAPTKSAVQNLGHPSINWHSTSGVKRGDKQMRDDV